MKIAYSRLFIKQAKKLSPDSRTKLQEKIKLFIDNPLHPSLRNHSLKGKYKDYRSIDITGGVRALYLQQDNEAVFDVISTHSQLYG